VVAYVPHSHDRTQLARESGIGESIQGTEVTSALVHDESLVRRLELVYTSGILRALERIRI
jgi:hypothetical protein